MTLHQARAAAAHLNVLLQAIKAALGAPPFFKEEDGQAQQNGPSEESGKAEGSATTAKAQQASHRPAVLADGSYASQTALTDTFTMPSMASNSPLNLRWVSYPGPEPAEQQASLVWGRWGRAWLVLETSFSSNCCSPLLLSETFLLVGEGAHCRRAERPHDVPARAAGLRLLDAAGGTEALGQWCQTSLASTMHSLGAFV